MNKHFYFRLLFLLMAFSPLSMFAGNNYFTPKDITLTGCAGVSVTGSSGSITVSGLGSYSHVQVFTPGFAAQVFNQEITNSSITIPIATAGDYIVKIWSNPNPSAFCEENFPVTVGGGGNPSTLTITCPATISVTAAQGATSATVNYTNATATTTCATGGASVTRTSGLASGSAFPIGTSQVCFKATDNCGNSKECCVSITVSAAANPCDTDNQAPTFTNCPTASINVTAAQGATCATATYTEPAATDNCGTPTVSRVLGLASGSCFPIGTTLVKYMATDAKGNSAICVFNVVVSAAANPCDTDTQSPTFTNCPSSVTVTAAQGANCATVNYANPVATDNCGTPTVSRVLGLASGSCFPVGTTLVKYMATDAKGNSAICVFNVVVNAAVNPCDNDTQAPTITCPAAITKDVTGMSGTCWTISYANATATDNCGTAHVVRESGLASGSCFPIGVSHVIFKATDAKGNVSRCTLVITIKKTDPCATDVTAPIITCPAAITKDVTGMSGTCWNISYNNATATDNCGTAHVVRESGLSSGSCFPIGVSHVVFKATDSKGNVSRCTLVITIKKTDPCANDVTAPVISCPAAITKDVTGMSGTCWNISYANATATDNCGTVHVVRESGLASGSCFPIGVNHVIFKATDAKGNVSRCTLVVSIVKNQTCTFDANKCYKIVNRYSGKVLDVSGWSTANDAAVQQWAYGGQNNQKWRIVSTGGGFNKIVNVHSGKVLASHEAHDGTKVYQYDYYTGGAKDWKIECLSGGYTKITHKLSGRCLDTEGYGSSTENGSKATIQNCDGTNSQQWQIVEAPCANYVHANATQLLTMTASAEPNRSRLEFVSNTGYMNDFFKVEKVNMTTGNFDQMEIVANKNSTETLEHYVVYDNEPAEGENIYRVTVFYNDGTNKTTDLKTVVFKGLDGVRVFPNPTDDILDVDLSKYKGQEVSLQLYNQFGQQVQVMNVEKAGGTVRLDVSQQQTGNYLLRVASKGKRDVMQKVIIAE